MIIQRLKDKHRQQDYRFWRELSESAVVANYISISLLESVTSTNPNKCWVWTLLNVKHSFIMAHVLFDLIEKSWILLNHVKFDLVLMNLIQSC
jgi:hypothetical protein